MAYPNYFPVGYQTTQPFQYQYPQPQPQPQPQQSNGIIWIQGEGAARSYLVSPNTSVVLFDSDDPMFYIKSADQSGMPTLRKFRFEEVTETAKSEPKAQTAPDLSGYITREEFENRIAELASSSASAPVKKTATTSRKEQING